VKQRIVDAVESGIIFGIKWGISLLVVGLLNFAWMGDYWSIRQMALHGEQIYQMVLQQQQAQKAAARPQEPK